MTASKPGTNFRQGCGVYSAGDWLAVYLTGDFEHIGSIVARFLASLEAEAEVEIERLGGFAGRVRPRQRAWSYALDRIEAECQETIR